MSRSQRERMKAGTGYACVDPELEALRAKARCRLQARHHAAVAAWRHRPGAGPTLRCHRRGRPRRGAVPLRLWVQHRSRRAGLHQCGGCSSGHRAAHHRPSNTDRSRCSHLSRRTSSRSRPTHCGTGDRETGQHRQRRLDWRRGDHPRRSHDRRQGQSSAPARWSPNRLRPTRSWWAIPRGRWNGSANRDGHSAAATISMARRKSCGTTNTRNGLDRPRMSTVAFRSARGQCPRA